MCRRDSDNRNEMFMVTTLIARSPTTERNSSYFRTKTNYCIFPAAFRCIYQFSHVTRNNSDNIFTTWNIMPVFFRLTSVQQRKWTGKSTPKIISKPLPGTKLVVPPPRGISCNVSFFQICIFSSFSLIN